MLRSEALNPGDPITAYRQSTGHWLRTEHATVKQVGRGVLLYVPVGQPNTEIIAFAKEEGITWIRGHHAETSDEAQAMIVARSLRSVAHPFTFVCQDCGHTNIEHKKHPNPTQVASLGPCYAPSCTCVGY